MWVWVTQKAQIGLNCALGFAVSLLGEFLVNLVVAFALFGAVSAFPDVVFLIVAFWLSMNAVPDDCAPDK